MSTKTVLIVTNGSQDKSNEDSRFSGIAYDSIDCECQDYLQKLSNLTASYYDEAYLFWVTPTSEILEKLLPVLKPKGKLLLEHQIPDRESGQAVCLDLQISGFVDAMAAKDPTTGDRFIVCEKPAWETGESATINIPASTSNTWKMDTGDLAEDDLVDENELLDDGLVITPGAGCGSDAKGPGKRRACKNCSCGLADLEAAGKADEAPAIKSNCGSCYKGDAFRCASCPFLGQPAFEPGTNRVMLSAGGDDI